MKATGIKKFLARVGYDISKDKAAMDEILLLTKTRDNINLSPEDFERGYGMEQSFLIRAIAESLNISSFFEIGTGRGTASYAVSRIPSVKEIVTVDIVPFSSRSRITISYQPAFASNEDIYNLISFQEKNKIKFKHVSDYESIKLEKPDHYDLCFIDGCHEDASVIREDFNTCLSLVKDGGYIIWDDYDPSRFEVKNVVDDICEKFKYESELIEFRGHIFGDKTPERGAGEVLMRIKK